jgi:nucleotide-binding universal stress UspA family protein
MKNIIVPIDFSSFSERALEAAIYLAYKAEAALHLVHVIPSDWNGNLLLEKEKQKHQQLLDQAQAAENKLAGIIDQNKLTAIQVEKTVLHGYAHEQIIQYARKKSADLIVIGAHNTENKDKFYIGSILQKVLRTASCPVLVIKNQADAAQFSKLVFASDFDELAKPAFQQVKDFAKWLGATLHLLFINTPAKFVSTPQAHSHMNSFLTGLEGVPVHTHLFDAQTIEEGLESFIHTFGECCLVVATHERKLSSLYLTGITESMVSRLDYPLLSIKMHR